MADARSLLGTKIGDYRLTAVLSEKPASAVFRGEHEQMGRAAACKIRWASHLTAGDIQDLGTIRAGSQVGNPHVIDVFDCGLLADGSPYLLMELLMGEPLAARLEKRALTMPELGQLTSQLGEALAAVHAAGLVHGALQPSNIFLAQTAAPSPLVKLINLAQRQTPDGGDKDFLAPELRHGAAPDARSDVFAMAALVRSLLPSGVQTSRLHEVLQRACSADPALRPESALALAAELAPALAETTPPRGRATRPPEDPTVISPVVVPDAKANSVGDHAPALIPGPTVTGVRARRIFWLGVPVLCLGAVFSVWYALRKPAPSTAKKGAAEVAAAHTPRALRELALAVLYTGLRSPVAAVRLAALRGLGQSVEPRFQPAVAPLLDDDQEEIALEAVRLIGQLPAPSAVPLLRSHALGAHTDAARYAYGLALLGAGEVSGAAMLRELLTRIPPAALPLQVPAALALSPQDATARKLLEPLSKGDPATDPLAHQVLLAQARHGDSKALTALRETLLRLPTGEAQLVLAGELLALESTPAAQEVLKQALAGDGGFHRLAATQLCLAGDLETAAEVHAALFDPRGPLPGRMIAATALGRCGERAEMDALVTLSRDPTTPEALRMAAAGSLLRLASSDPELLAEASMNLALLRLSDTRPSVRQSAVALLGDLPGSALQRSEVAHRLAPLFNQAVTTALTDRETEVRLATVEALTRLSRRLPGTALGNGGPLAPLRELLTEQANRPTGPASTRLLAAATLLQLGDEGQRGTVEQSLRDKDPALRELATRAAGTARALPTELLIALLEDPVAVVQLRAAYALAERGRAEGVAVLRAAMTRGGDEGLRALSALQRLDAALVSEAGRLDSPEHLIGEDDPRRRLLGLELAAPTVRRLRPLLWKLTHDPDAAVRFRVVELGRELGAEGRQLLLALAEDTDLAVRTHAQECLLLLPTAPPKAAEADAPPPATHPAPAKLPSTALRVLPGSVLPFSVDRREFRDLPAEPIALSPGSHVIGFHGGVRNIHLRPRQTLALRIAPSDIEQAYLKATAALGRRESTAARGLLERISRLCARDCSSDDRMACQRIGSEVAYKLGVLYEGSKLWRLALVEFQRVEKDGPPEHRAQAVTAVQRLRSHLGRLRLYKRQGAQCQPSELWLEPGTHLINVGGGERKAVKLSAGETAELRLCN